MGNEKIGVFGKAPKARSAPAAIPAKHDELPTDGDPQVESGVRSAVDPRAPRSRLGPRVCPGPRIQGRPHTSRRRRRDGGTLLPVIGLWDRGLRMFAGLLTSALSDPGWLAFDSRSSHRSGVEPHAPPDDLRRDAIAR